MMGRTARVRHQKSLVNVTYFAFRLPELLPKVNVSRTAETVVFDNVRVLMIRAGMIGRKGRRFVNGWER